MISDFCILLSLDNTLAFAGTEVASLLFSFARCVRDRKNRLPHFFLLPFFFLSACSYIVLVIAQTHNSVLQSIRAERLYFHIFNLYFRFSFPPLSFLLWVLINDEACLFPEKVTIILKKHLFYKYLERIHLFIYNKVNVRGIPQRFRLH